MSECVPKVSECVPKVSDCVPKVSECVSCLRPNRREEAACSVFSTHWSLVHDSLLLTEVCFCLFFCFVFVEKT